MGQIGSIIADTATVGVRMANRLTRIVDFFNRSYDTAQEAMRAASDAQLTAGTPQENPIQQFRPTLASLLNFYMVGHITVHLGQVSAWRRIEGMPPA